MFTLTFKEVSNNAAKYYRAGKLNAQHPDPDKRRCQNSSEDGYRCAVAASYPEDFKEEGAFFDLVRRGLIEVSDQEDIIRIQRLQDAHDHWANVARVSEDLEALNASKKLFLQALSRVDSFEVQFLA